MTDPKKAPQARMSTPQRATLATLIGGTAASLLLAGLTSWEGKRNVGYRDIVGIPTACMGDTQDVVVGKFYSDAECYARLERQAKAHVEEVLACTPGLKGHDHQLVAAGLLAYNIGGRAYCRSTAAKRFNARDWRGACDAFRMWNKAGGRVVRGLVNRREFERRLCLTKVPA